MIRTVTVSIWDKEIGRLLWDNSRRLSYFTFNPVYLQSGLDIAPLTAPIHDRRSSFPIYGDSDRIYQKLPPFLADSLPDDWGSRLFDVWRKEQRIPMSSVTPLDKLSFIGKRGMGALEFEPDADKLSSRESINVSALVNLAHKIFAEGKEVEIKPEESLTMQSLIAVGSSAGGRQPKAIVAIDRNTGDIRSGQIAGLDGYDYCILKFGDETRSSAELEHAYYLMAKAAGISMMPSCLLDVDGNKHFLTERFDRKNGEKLHTQTLAAMSPGASSYEELLLTCRRLGLPEPAQTEIFRRMVFNILANNTDDHTKNFSFIMDKVGKWQLSPAYDMTYIFNIGGYQPQEEHCMSVNGKLTDIMKEDALAVAKDNGIRRPEAIIREVSDAISAFCDFASQSGVRNEWAGRVEKRLHDQLRSWGFVQGAAISSHTFAIEDHIVSDMRLEEAYRGNYHLQAKVDGKTYRYIIRKGTEEYNSMSSIGLANIDQDGMRNLVRAYILPKVQK